MVEWFVIAVARGRVFFYLCCLFFRTISQKPTKNIEMFHDESRKPSYLGVKRSKVRVTSHKTLLEWVFALL